MWLPRLLQAEPVPLQVAVDGAELTVGGRRVPLPGDRRVLVRLLGEPSFVLELVNTLSVWDELGLVAYQPPGGGPVFSVSAVLGELTGFGFWPRRPFPGRLTLDGAVVTADATIGGINAAKAGAKLAPAGGGCCWAIDHGGVVIAVSTARGGRFEAGGAVAELAITARQAECGAAAESLEAEIIPAIRRDEEAERRREPDRTVEDEERRVRRVRELVREGIALDAALAGRVPGD